MGSNSGSSGTKNVAVRFIRDLYVDPFKWSLVKSISLFTVAVLFAREMASASAEPVQ